MPVIKKNRRPFLYPAGTKTALGKCAGWLPAKAIQIASKEFVKEHGFEANQDERCFITVGFTTFETIAEVSIRPED